MKLTINTTILFCLVWFSANGQAYRLPEPTLTPVFKNEDLTVSKITEHRWVVETTDNTTMYIIEGAEKTMLIDTGTDCKDLDKVVKQISSKPLLVVLTHAHGDHAGNIRYFDEIYVHAADTVLMDGAYRGKVHYMIDGARFDLGGGTLIEVLHTPGHTPGCVTFLDRSAAIAYTGDSFGSGPVWLHLRPLLPITVYEASIRKMLSVMEQKGITDLYCGHYPYLKRALGRQYIENMAVLASRLVNQDTVGAKRYSPVVSIGAQNPMLLTTGFEGIVYDPDNL